MTSDTTWHADRELLAGYVAGTTGRARTASVEAHLLTCASCRAAVAPLVASDRLARNLDVITERVDQPRANVIEQLLRRVGVPDRIGRVLTVTPSALGAWLTAIVVAVLVAGIVDLRGGSDRASFLVLVAAPLLPLTGIAAVFSTRGDPARELVVAAPTSGFEVLLIRALAVLAPAIVFAAVAAALVPERGWDPVLWLVPSFALTATTLALGSWFPVRWVAWALGGIWVAAAAISIRGVPSADLVDHFIAFRAAGQLVLVAVALAASAVVVLRRHAFDSVDLRRTS
jgi:hypothetical protein